MHLQRQATTSAAFSNQPGTPTATPRHSGLPSPCSEQPVMMTAAGLQVSAPAESSRQVVSEAGTACPAAHGDMGILAQPHGLSSGWLEAAVPLCGPQTCPTTPHWDLQWQRQVGRQQ